MDALQLESQTHYAGNPSLLPDDLIQSLRQTLLSAKEITDVDNWLAKVNGEIRKGELPKHGISELKKLRQRGYDKKRKMPITAIEELPESKGQADSKAMEGSSKSVEVIDSPTKTPISVSQRSQNQENDKPDLIRNLLAILFSGLVVVGSSFLFWMQSIDLYTALGFATPKLASIGGLLISLSFAAYFGITRSKIALVCCIYSISYEGFLVVSGTETDEKIRKTELITTDPIVLSQLAKVEFSQKNYNEAIERYSNPKDRVFKNQWYRSKFVKPRLDALSEATIKLEAMRNEFKSTQKYDHRTYLKISYRLGILICLMVFAHQCTGQIWMAIRGPSS